MDWKDETSYESDVLIEEEVDTSDPAQLIVYNDDYNTFDWVIQCFVEVLNHTVEQSEQLSLIIHFKGKAIVKTGQFEKLNKWRRQLTDRGLNAVVELIPT
jgi:ATP-dependent Clp protease adaptor protein ClpS